MILPRDEVARHLAVSTNVLVRYESRGLVRARSEGGIEGYGPAEVRRLWTIVSCQRDLGINLAGVEAVLKLRDHLVAVHRHVDRLSDQLRQWVDENEARDADHG